MQSFAWDCLSWSDWQDAETAAPHILFQLYADKDELFDGVEIKLPSKQGRTCLQVSYLWLLGIQFCVCPIWHILSIRQKWDKGYKSGASMSKNLRCIASSDS